jgi:murein DD-endopeptidase MepM/ murein hydrolase activator NlpD
MSTQLSRRWFAATAVAVLLVAAPPVAVAAGSTSPVAASAVAATPGAITYSRPLSGPLVVVNPFRAPPTPYAAGHRGVDFATEPGQIVYTAAPGRVTFAGVVAGRAIVVVEHADGVSTEYEPILVLVSPDQMVTAGTPLGRVSGTHGGCRPDRCLHWGARRDGEYFDPLSLLRPLGPVRLLPWT